VARLLVADEHGNPIDKKYEELTPRELSVLTEALCQRFYLFNYDYPEFLNQTVKGILEHPSLLKSDKTMLETYARMFEVDWDGQKASHLSFLFMQPVYLRGERVVKESRKDMIR